MYTGVVLNPTIESPATQDLLEELQRNGLVTERDASRTIAATKTSSAAIETLLLELGIIEEDDLYPALAKFLQVPLSNPKTIDQELLTNLELDADFLTRVGVVPMSVEGDTLIVATARTDAADILQAIAFKIERPIRATLATPSAVSDVFAQLSDRKSVTDDVSGAGDAERLRILANEGPVIRLVTELIGKASAEGASDIHVEAIEHGAVVRFRVDGHLVEDKKLNVTMAAAVVSRLKVLSNLNISEKRRPQDGRASVTIRGRAIDLRLSTLPTQYGESIVIRLLDQKQQKLDWRALGYSEDKIATIRALINQPNGIVLVAGPTGSGKTTSLYTALSELNAPDRKVVTVEDPIEYAIEGINQVQVEPEIEMTFARALRAILRQDPDIVMVGEIRDQETAEIAVRAALVGRLVLSTVHTNDSISSIARLLDLGVPSYLLGATLRGVISQRLVRQLCETCFGKGCINCKGAGKSGRTIISETLLVDSHVSEAIAAGADATQILSLAQRDGFTSMAEDARRLVQERRVSEKEILQVI